MERLHPQWMQRLMRLGLFLMALLGLIAGTIGDFSLLRLVCLFSGVAAWIEFFQPWATEIEIDRSTGEPVLRVRSTVFFSSRHEIAFRASEIRAIQMVYPGIWGGGRIMIGITTNIEPKVATMPAVANDMIAFGTPRTTTILRCQNNAAETWRALRLIAMLSKELGVPTHSAAPVSST